MQIQSSFCCLSSHIKCRFKSPKVNYHVHSGYDSAKAKVLNCSFKKYCRCARLTWPTASFNCICHHPCGPSSLRREMIPPPSNLQGEQHTPWLQAQICIYVKRFWKVFKTHSALAWVNEAPVMNLHIETHTYRCTYFYRSKSMHACHQSCNFRFLQVTKGSGRNADKTKLTKLTKWIAQEQKKLSHTNEYLAIQGIWTI